MNRIFSVLVVLIMFSMTACGTEHTPDFVENDIALEKTVLSLLVVGNKTSEEEGFLRTREDLKGFQKPPNTPILMTKKSLPVVKIRVGEIQIMEVMN